MLKTLENPPILSPWAGCTGELQGRWWVAHTRSRFEKAFAWDLMRLQVGCFLPMVERVQIRQGRKRKAMTPLFPGYVFFCGSARDRHLAMTTNRLCQTLPVTDQQALIADLAALEKALAGKADLDPHPFAVEGRRCRVRSGPFAGIEGVISGRARPARLVLTVRMLGQGASMEIDTDLLEPLD